MELLVIFAAVIALDVFALEAGFDSSGSQLLTRHDRALDALKHGDLDTYRAEIDRLERELARDTWRIF